MTLAHGTDRLESARLVLRRIGPDDLPFFTRIHALPQVAEHLYPGGRPRSPDETAAWLWYTLASYEQLALGYLAVVRKEDGALIGRCVAERLPVASLRRKDLEISRERHRGGHQHGRDKRPCRTRG